MRYVIVVIGCKGNAFQVNGRSTFFGLQDNFPLCIELFAYVRINVILLFTFLQQNTGYPYDTILLPGIGR